VQFLRLCLGLQSAGTFNFHYEISQVLSDVAIAWLTAYLFNRNKE